MRASSPALFVLTMLVIWPGHGWGQAMIGVGLGSCGGWTSHRQTPPGTGASTAEQWVVGYLSGQGHLANAVGNALDPLKGVDAEGVWAWIDNYCRANPLKRVWEAAGMFTLAHPH
jgi:hypothetical protein